jgi:hypothetical protein
MRTATRVHKGEMSCDASTYRFNGDGTETSKGGERERRPGWAEAAGLSDVTYHRKGTRETEESSWQSKEASCHYDNIGS